MNSLTEMCREFREALDRLEGKVDAMTAKNLSKGSVITPGLFIQTQEGIDQEILPNIPGHYKKQEETND